MFVQGQSALLKLSLPICLHNLRFWGVVYICCKASVLRSVSVWEKTGACHWTQGRWCQILKALGSQCHPLEQLGSLPSSEGPKARGWQCRILCWHPGLSAWGWPVPVSPKPGRDVCLCLQSQYKMEFRCGYSENMRQQGVLSCLLYVYLWCRPFLPSTAPSSFLSKAWYRIRGVWCPEECNSSCSAAATQPAKNKQEVDCFFLFLAFSSLEERHSKWPYLIDIYS